jgi:hypothetical protein
MGTIGGFGAELDCARHHAQGRRDAFERHVARVCVDAAKRGADVDETKPEAW